MIVFHSKPFKTPTSIISKNDEILHFCPKIRGFVSSISDFNSQEMNKKTLMKTLTEDLFFFQKYKYFLFKIFFRSQKNIDEIF